MSLPLLTNPPPIGTFADQAAYTDSSRNDGIGRGLPSNCDSGHSRSTHNAKETELETIRPVGLARQTWGIQDAKLLTLLPSLKVGGKLRLVFFRQEGLIICPGLIVVASDIRQLLFEK